MTSTVRLKNRSKTERTLQLPQGTGLQHTERVVSLRTHDPATGLRGVREVAITIPPSITWLPGEEKEVPAVVLEQGPVKVWLARNEFVRVAGLG